MSEAIRKQAGKAMIEWKAEHDVLIRSLAAIGYTISSVLEVLEDTYPELVVSKSSLARHMRQIGAMTERAKAYKSVPVTKRMLDFCFAKRDLPMAELTAAFNLFFGKKWSEERVYRIFLQAKAGYEQPKTEQWFRDTWYDLQMQFAPHGEMGRKHWLWRSTVLDETRPASGIRLGKDKAPRHTVAQKDDMKPPLSADEV